MKLEKINIAGSGVVRLKTLYCKNGIIGKLKDYFSRIFADSTAPIKQHLFDLFLSILALNLFQSVKFNFEHFIAGKSDYKLKSCYYALNESRIDLQSWLRNLLKVALSLLPQANKQPVILSIDDTMIEKSGSHFDLRSCLFDHAKHNGSSYLHGHCFVCLMLSLPISSKEDARYLCFPLAYRMWDKRKSKLDIAAELVQSAMKIIGTKQSVCLCCDSWYPKGTILPLREQFANLTIICNARSDTVLYDLPPEKSGKRGRPRQRGEKLTLDSFVLSDIPNTDFQAGSRTVLTNLFGKKTVFAIVTKKRSGNTRRLFLCTKMPAELGFSPDFLAPEVRFYAKTDETLLPLSIYTLRWNIEVAFYEQKAFWSLKDYKLRSKTGIERLTNLLLVTYSSMKLLPWLDSSLSGFREISPQQIRFQLGTLIRKQIFLTTFANSLEPDKNNRQFVDFLRNVASDFLVAA